MNPMLLKLKEILKQAEMIVDAQLSEATASDGVITAEEKKELSE